MQHYQAAGFSTEVSKFAAAPKFKLKGAGVTLYFTPEFVRKNQRPNQVNDLWYIPAVLTGRPEFGATNCPVRAFKYYHRYNYV